MPPPVSSPTRLSRPKRESMTITRSVGKALADVMNKDSIMVTSSTESDTNGTASPPARTRAAATSRPATRDGVRAARPSIDASNGASGKSTPNLTKRPLPSSASKAATTRSKGCMPPPAPPTTRDPSPNKPTEKPSKPRASLTLRGLSSTFQPKPANPPSALPKLKHKPAAESVSLPRSGARKRLSGWDVDKAPNTAAEANKSSDDDADDDDDDFVNVERPISPLPRRVTRKNLLPVSLSLTPSTPPKRGNVLRKASSSSSSMSPRAKKTAKTSATSASPVTRLQSPQPRPASVASNGSQRRTPMQSARKHTSTSSPRATPSGRPVHRKSPFVDLSTTTNSDLELSPGNPFQLPKTSESSLMSPPLSPFLEGVSLDSIDAGDVSALLSTVISPVKPAAGPSQTLDVPQTPARHLQIFPKSGKSFPPQTPVSTRNDSTLTTDPRQSILSLRQFLENSGDLEHLLSQPLPSIFTPDARERLLSFGFSPEVPPPFPSAVLRPEPQTPCPASDGRSFTSISQVLFPSVAAPEEDRSAVEFLQMQLTAAENQRAERDTKIEALEKQLTMSREAREREAAELSTQVTDLEERLQELLNDREREAEKRASDLEERLRDKDTEWERNVAVAIAQVHQQSQADQDRLLNLERRKASIRSAASAWECAQEVACSELELIRANRRFVEVTLAGLDASMAQLRGCCGNDA
ncbi:hypothetical protein K439DRAFT_1626558 [Ramaria rubella]|nr:hypothetical protein K439DRAFT_1626558 [Ramaria rubella]